MPSFDLVRYSDHIHFGINYPRAVRLGGLEAQVVERRGIGSQRVALPGLIGRLRRPRQEIGGENWLPTDAETPPNRPDGGCRTRASGRSGSVQPAVGRRLQGVG